MMPWREEQIGDCRLILGDCLELLPILSANAVISDPPYGIGYQHRGHVRGDAAAIGITAAANRRGSPPIRGDDKPFEPAPLLKYSNIMLWGADHFYSRLPNKGRWLAWNKLAGMEPWDTFSDVEFAWHNKEGASRIFSMLWKGLACDKRGERNGLREHPMQKPVRLARWCIEQSGAPLGDTILDPYMGSGTVGVACVQMGYRFIGVEIEEKYFDMACRRCKEATRQPALLMSPNRGRVQQESLPL